MIFKRVSWFLEPDVLKTVELFHMCDWQSYRCCNTAGNSQTPAWAHMGASVC